MTLSRKYGGEIAVWAKRDYLLLEVGHFIGKSYVKTRKMADFEKGSRLSFVLTYVLIIGFASTSWLAINGIWAELPLLTTVSPDGFALPAILSLTVQFANIGTLTYLFIDFIDSLISKRKGRTKSEGFLTLAVCILIILGTVSCVAMALTYQETSPIGNSQHSVPLIIFVFIFALVDCISSVTYLPFMARFKSKKFITALYVGEGLSGVIPSVLSLSQGLNLQHPDTNRTASCNETSSLATNFSGEVYFFLLAAFMIFSGVCFGFLHVLPCVSILRVKKSKNKNSPKKGQESGKLNDTPTDDDTEPLIFESSIQKRNRKSWIKSWFSFNRRTGYLLVLVMILNMLANGALPAVSSYALACYGPKTYVVGLNLGLIMAPMTSFVALFLPVRSFIGINILFIVGVAFAVLIIILGFLGLTINLPLLGSPVGSALTVSHIEFSNCIMIFGAF